MTVKIGMIGAGGIAQSHINQIVKVPNAKIVTIFDVNREGAEKVAAELGATVADSADALLNPNEIDAVFICVPQFARGDLEETAAKRGIPLFVEKPLGIDLETVKRKEQVIRETGILHSVGYVLRYYDSVQRAKQYLQDKTIHLIQIYRFGGSHPSFWWKQLNMSGGNLNDAVTHQIDMTRYIAGEFRNVYAQFGNNSIQGIYPEATIPDGGAVSFAMQNGAVGTLTESCISKLHSASEIKVFGPDYFLHLTGNGKNLTIKEKDQTETIESKLVASYEQDKAFIDAVASGSRDNILCTYSDGLRSLEVSLAAIRSGETGQPVGL
ncbi:MAG: oxidoreductase [Paenibacillus sp.]|nr:oxidoreductase [Paenibacillus sp.]